MSVTVSDVFCGSGGSSLGAEAVGAKLVFALNHWDVAIECHNTNFPDADHARVNVKDLRESHIRRYPDSDVLIASPECLNHSVAKGAKARKEKEPSFFDLENGELPPAKEEEQERSRATMNDVARFAEQKALKGRPYLAIVIENVVEAYKWGVNNDGRHFKRWLNRILKVGYEHEIMWLNSMFVPPVPQSRDRMYVVFWRKGLRRPNLKVEPPSWCPSCERVVEGRQTFKRLDRAPWGRYGQQYFYTCPECRRAVIPGAYPAASIIDHSIPITPIGERAKPLKPATRERIARGLNRLAREPFELVPGEVGRLTTPKPETLPIVGMGGVPPDEDAMILPVAGNTYETTPGNRAKRARVSPYPTIHASLDKALVTRTGHKTANGALGRDAALSPTLGLATHNDLALVMANTEHGVPKDAESFASQTIRTEGGLSLVYGNRTHGVPRDAAHNHSRKPCANRSVGLVEVQRKGEVRDPMSVPAHTVRAGGGHHGVVVANYDPGWARRSSERPIGSVTTADGHSLVVPYTRTSRPLVSGREPASTLSTRDRLALLVPPAVPEAARDREGVFQPVAEEDIDACGFRMFSIPEIAGAMAMLTDPRNGLPYVLVGNRTQRTRLLGNAVTPPVMSLIFSRLLPILDERGGTGGSRGTASAA